MFNYAANISKEIIRNYDSLLYVLHNCILIVPILWRSFFHRKMVQTCSFCNNHGIRAEKKGHKTECPFSGDHWKLCTEGCYDTKTRQESVAEEKRKNYQLAKTNKEVSMKQPVPAGKKRAPKMCRKCKNHGKDEIMNIKHQCHFKKCDCKNCKSTEQRRTRVRVDVKNIRSNLNTVLITPPSTPGSSSSQNSPSSGASSDADAASPLRFDAETHELYDVATFTPDSMTSHDSPADTSSYSPARSTASSEYDLFAPMLPPMSPPSAVLVDQNEMSFESEYYMRLKELSACPVPQNYTNRDSEMCELLSEASFKLRAQPESFQKEVEAVCIEGKKSYIFIPRPCSNNFSCSFL